MGPITELSMAFVADVATQEGLVAIQGANEGSVALPTGSNPSGILGVLREDRAAGEHVSVSLKGIEYVAAGGTCTRGSRAAVLSGGTVQNVATNATPVQQPYLGTFLQSGVSGALVLVQIEKGYVTQ